VLLVARPREQDDQAVELAQSDRAVSASVHSGGQVGDEVVIEERHERQAVQGRRGWGDGHIQPAVEHLLCEVAAARLVPSR
jgi:hypothetical protein